MTFKQLEAIYWVVKLRGFSHAAAYLHTTQSAVSKRVQELESLFDTPLFDRTNRGVKLTSKGEEMFSIAQRLLMDRSQAVEKFQRPEVTERRLRLGLTELSALTWLPAFIEMIQSNYPRVTIEPDIDGGISLEEKLLADSLDLVVAPELPDNSRLMKIGIGTVENAWMCKPGLVKKNKRLMVNELASFRFLSQGNRSGPGMVYEQWFNKVGFTPSKVLTSNNLIAIMGLTASGFGVSLLPKDCLRPITQAHILNVLNVVPALPKINYVATYKNENHNTFITSITEMAQKCCDFSKALQTTVA